MLPTLARLNDAQRAAYSYMQGAVARGLGANAALSQYQAIGGAIRRTAGLDLYRYIAGTVKAADVIRNVRKDYFPSVETIPYARTNIRREYSFNVELNLRSTSTGEVFTKNIQVTNDTLPRIRDIEMDAREAFYDPEQGREDTNVEILSITIVAPLRRAPIWQLLEE